MCVLVSLVMMYSARSDKQYRNAPLSVTWLLSFSPADERVRKGVHSCPRCQVHRAKARPNDVCVANDGCLKSRGPGFRVYSLNSLNAILYILILLLCIVNRYTRNPYPKLFQVEKIVFQMRRIRLIVDPQRLRVVLPFLSRVWILNTRSSSDPPSQPDRVNFYEE